MMGADMTSRTSSRERIFFIVAVVSLLTAGALALLVVWSVLPSGPITYLACLYLAVPAVVWAYRYFVLGKGRDR